MEKSPLNNPLPSNLSMFDALLLLRKVQLYAFQDPVSTGLQRAVPLAEATRKRRDSAKAQEQGQHRALFGGEDYFIETVAHQPRDGRDESQDRGSGAPPRTVVRIDVREYALQSCLASCVVGVQERNCRTVID